MNQPVATVDYPLEKRLIATRLHSFVTRGIMKALTISQPFAFLIASGVKYIENRRWPTNYRGELAIHAGKGTQYLDKDELKEYATGAVVAVAKLVACVTLEVIQAKANSKEQDDCIPGSKIIWKEASIHPHAEGPWCWILEDVREIEQVKMNGAQGLWEVTLPQVSYARNAWVQSVATVDSPLQKTPIATRLQPIVSR